MILGISLRKAFLKDTTNNLADGFNNFISGIGDFFANLIESLGIGLTIRVWCAGIR